MPEHQNAPDSLQLREGRLLRCRERRPGCSEWEVETGGQAARAVAYDTLTPSLEPNARVLLNTTAAALSLGTGGTHFVVAVLDAAPEEAPFAGREAGHIMRLRYTPLQHRVCSVEEEASPHREALLACRDLGGMRVLVAELHSQAAAAALAARAARPEVRIAWVQADTAALPLPYSRLVARLRTDGVLTASISVGQGFGGDYEAVNLYTGLLAARAVVRADLAIVTQGPGNVGTGTEYGFSGLGLVEALHAADLLGGVPLVAPRMSDADPRERHRGLSHHTRTLLRCTRAPVTVPYPAGTADMEGAEGGAGVRHRLQPVTLPAGFDPFACYEQSLSTMGRSVGQDKVFFQAAAAAGYHAAQDPGREQE